MKRFRELKISGNTIHLAINSYRLGDNIASFPTLRYLVKNGKNYGIRYKVHVINHNFNDIYKLALPDVEFDNYKGSNFPYLTHFAFSNVPTFASNLIDHISFNLAQTSLLTKDKIYPKVIPPNFDFDFDISNSVVISVGYTWETKKFTKKFIQEAIEKITSMGYLPVLVGTDCKNFDIDQSITFADKAINLVNKTNLIELLYIIYKSKAVITHDNGILHLAALTDTPILAAFTVTSPEHSLPLREKIFPIVTEVDCKLCAVKGIHTFNKFDKCPYGDYICLEDLTSEKFIKVLKESVLHNLF